jgi:hypothetical protein
MKFPFLYVYSKLLKERHSEERHIPDNGTSPHHLETPPLTRGCRKRQLKTHCLQTLHMLVECSVPYG